MPDALPVPYERNVRRVVRAVQASPRGGLFICVGRSHEVRARVEAELDVRLAPGRVVVRASLQGAGGEPWRAIVAARDGSGRGADETVLSVGVGGGGMSEADEARDAEVLLRLNVGREVRVQQRLHLLLWVEGLVQLDRLRMKAPDLWAFRLDELFFLSRSDFQGFWTTNEDLRWSHADVLARIELRLASPLITSSERVNLLTRKAGRLRALDRPGAATHAITEAKALLREIDWSDRGHNVLRVNLLKASLDISLQVGLLKETRDRSLQFLREAIGTKNVLLRGVSSFSLAQTYLLCGDTAAAIAACDEFMSTIPESDRIGYPAWNSDADSLVVRARAWLAAGALDRCVADISEGLLRIDRQSRKDPSFTDPLVKLRVDATLCEVALHRGRTSENLFLATRAFDGQYALAGWHEIDERFRAITETHLRMGTVVDGRSIVEVALERARAWGNPLAIARWLHRLGMIQESLSAHAEALTCRREAIEMLEGQWSRDRRSLQGAETALLAAEIHVNAVAPLIGAGPATSHRQRAESLLLDALRSSRMQRHVDLELRCQEALARLYVSTGRFDAASRCLHSVLKSAERYKGPSALAATWIELARVEHARGDLPAALTHFDHARSQCERDEPRYRSRFVWKRLMVERHRTEAAIGDLRAAKACLDDALAVLRAEGLRLEEMDVLQHLAELAPSPGTDDHREGAAYAALEIARDAMFPSDEARAMLTLVELGLAAGQPDAVAGQYREAAWIVRELGPRELRRRAEQLAHHFGGAPWP